MVVPAAAIALTSLISAVYGFTSTPASARCAATLQWRATRVQRPQASSLCKAGCWCGNGAFREPQWGPGGMRVVAATTQGSAGAVPACGAVRTPAPGWKPPQGRGASNVRGCRGRREGVQGTNTRINPQNSEFQAAAATRSLWGDLGNVHIQRGTLCCDHAIRNEHRVVGHVAAAQVEQPGHLVCGRGAAGWGRAGGVGGLRKAKAHTQRPGLHACTSGGRLRHAPPARHAATSSGEPPAALRRRPALLSRHTPSGKTQERCASTQPPRVPHRHKHPKPAQREQRSVKGREKRKRARRVRTKHRDQQRAGAGLGQLRPQRGELVGHALARPLHGVHAQRRLQCRGTGASSKG